jgi:hypothetical protein
MKIRVNQKSSVSGASWCVPVGWEPDNQIEGAEFVDGSWWTEESEEAGLLYFGDGEAGTEVEATFADIRVASCGNCQVIGEVEHEEL